ncbi:MAG TPA: SUMF1/EgtB/PvdO family nonheme iron enzyme [Roseiflexaceae bacterium]|nr:SUMF1/EgtB/PvdO family nonheme iron enzyme [Roseiflexaceae bacterium]
MTHPQEHGRDDDPLRYVALARELVSQGEPHAAAIAYDRAFGLAPDDNEIAAARSALLDQLAIVEHGIVFRYIPAGTFLMGSERGDPDEAPVHPVQLSDFWLAETPISWARHCALMGWEPPPAGVPTNYREQMQMANREDWHNWFFGLWGVNRIRLQYCEDETSGARDWHAHMPEQLWTRGNDKQISARELFGEVPREHPERPWGYDQKPMVAVAWEEAVALGERISTSQITYRLPTEAEWEKAARGGLIDASYRWGDEPPSAERCDFDRFEQFSIRRMRAFPPNEYGLYAMSGSVWEWTADWYDATYYSESPPIKPTGPANGEERVLRGGSWADCADALRVSFRMSCRISAAPTIGVRLCRVEREPEG